MTIEGRASADIYPVHSSGMRATGHWVEFGGQLYPITSYESGYELRYFGDAPPSDAWERRRKQGQRQDGLVEYTRIISAKDAKRYGRLHTEAMWGGRQFDVMGFEADSQAILFACVSEEDALALVAGEHSWEMVDRGFVSGVVPVSELTDVVETFKDYPLPRV